MKGVYFNDKHSFKDFGLVLSSKVITPPEPQLNLVQVPFRDGSIDLQLTDDVKYKDRTINLTFSLMEGVFNLKVSELQNYLHGERMKIIFDDDASFYYIGRVNVTTTTYEKRIGTINIQCIVEPYKYDINIGDDWLWDSFDFESGIINQTLINVDEEINIEIYSRRKRTVPTFTADADMLVSFNGIDKQLYAGIPKKIYEFIFTEGLNILFIIGNGTVKIDFEGGSL
jgi:predicted phage tail component-like protein